MLLLWQFYCCSFLCSSQIFGQIAGAKRGPPRFLGRTKTQYLDVLMRSNATICATASLSFFPIVAYYMYRYYFVLKPVRDETARLEKEALLAEGQAAL